MTAWFGEPWPSAELRASVCEDDNLRWPVPVGKLCLFCEEPIGPDDRGVVLPVMRSKTEATLDPAHIECHVRQALGGPAHQLGLCSCHGGTSTDPDMGLSRREAALAVWRWLYTTQEGTSSC